MAVLVCIPTNSVRGEFSKEEHWSGLSFPIPGDLPDPGIETASLALAGGFFTTKLLYRIEVS